MKCPVCKDVTLLMSEKHGIEIDYCPECRGIWLDRGELDKIVQRAQKDLSDDDDEAADGIMTGMTEKAKTGTTIGIMTAAMITAMTGITTGIIARSRKREKAPC